MVESAVGTTIDGHDLESGDLTLVIGWRSGRKTKLAQLTLGADVAAALRDVVVDAARRIVSLSAEPWAPDADLSQETYLVVPTQELGDAPALASEFEAHTLVAHLMAAQNLPTLKPEALPSADLSFYAVTVGSDPSDRIAFLRRVNARRGLRGGKILGSYRDALVRIDDPIFAFDATVDLVFTAKETVILSQSAFVALFREQESLLQQIPKWAMELAEHVPIGADGLQRLSAKAIRDSRARTRLEAIVKRGHLADVTVEELRIKLVEVGLDESLIDDNGELVFEEEDIPAILQFLNEDLFPGVLTGVGFRADRKAAR